MSWEIRVHKDVEKEMRRFPLHDKNRILEGIDEIRINPYIGDIKKMSGEENVWRRRIGSYRIFYELYYDESCVVIFRVERRTSKTY